MNHYFKRFTSVEALGFTGSVLSLLLGFTSIGAFEKGKWAVLAGVLLYLSGKRRVSPLTHVYFKIVLFIGIACVVSVIHSPDMWRSIQLAIALSMIFAASLLILSDDNRIAKKFAMSPKVVGRRIERLAWGYVLISVLFFVPGLIFLAAGINQLPLMSLPLFTGLEEGWSVRYAGILGNPNQIGICAAVLVPVIFSKALEKPKKRKFCWLLLGLVFYSVFLSGSRNGLLSSGIGCAAVIILAGYGNRWVRVIAVVCALSLAVTLNLALFKEYFTRAKGKRVTVEEAGQNRLSRWEVGLKSIKKRPVGGQGIGIGGVPKNGYVKPTGIDTGYPLHNSYLQITQEIGLLGLIPVMLALMYGIHASLRKNRLIARSASLRHNYAGFAGVILAGTASAVFESWLIAPGNLGTMPFWCAFGVVSVVASMDGRVRGRQRVAR